MVFLRCRFPAASAMEAHAPGYNGANQRLYGGGHHNARDLRAAGKRPQDARARAYKHVHACTNAPAHVLWGWCQMCWLFFVLLVSFSLFVCMPHQVSGLILVYTVSESAQEPGGGEAAFVDRGTDANGAHKGAGRNQTHGVCASTPVSYCSAVT